MVGISRVTTSETTIAAPEAVRAYSVPSRGMKTTDSVCDPALSTSPAAGEYSNVPGIEAEALSWASPRGVPQGIGFGEAHSMFGTILATVTETVVCAVV